MEVVEIISFIDMEMPLLYLVIKSIIAATGLKDILYGI